MKKNILIGIIHYLMDSELKKCLQSLEQEIKNNNKYNFKILIISNSKIKFKVKKKYLVINNKKNMHFSFSANQIFEYGIKNKYEKIFLLNNDLRFLKDSLKNILKVSFDYKKPSILSPIQLNNNLKLDEKTKTLYNFNKCNIFDDLLANKTIKPYYKIKFINAAAWLIDSRVIKKLGGMNLIFNHFGNDNDYVRRAQKTGILHAIVPSSKIIHTRIFYSNNKISNLQKKSFLISSLLLKIMIEKNLINGLLTSLGLLIYYIINFKLSIVDIFKIIRNLPKTIKYRNTIYYKV